MTTSERNDCRSDKSSITFIAGFTFKRCKIVKKHYVLGELSHCISEYNFRLVSNGILCAHCFFVVLQCDFLSTNK